MKHEEVLNLGKHFVIIDTPVSFQLVDNYGFKAYRPAGAWQIDCWKLLPEKFHKLYPVYVLSIQWDDLDDNVNPVISYTDLDLGDGIAGVNGQPVMVNGEVTVNPVTIANKVDNPVKTVNLNPKTQPVWIQEVNPVKVDIVQSSDILKALNVILQNLPPKKDYKFYSTYNLPKPGFYFGFFGYQGNSVYDDGEFVTCGEAVIEISESLRARVFGIADSGATNHVVDQPAKLDWGYLPESIFHMYAYLISDSVPPEPIEPDIPISYALVKTGDYEGSWKCTHRYLDSGNVLQTEILDFPKKSTYWRVTQLEPPAYIIDGVTYTPFDFDTGVGYGDFEFKLKFVQDL